MEDVSRRGLFRILGTSAVAAGLISPIEAQMAHQAAAASQSLKAGANFVPKHLTRHHFQTMRVLGDLIVPADDHGPAASEAGAAEFIDFLCSVNADIAEIIDGGIAWLHAYTQHSYGSDFLTAKPDQQAAILDMAYGAPPSDDVAGGRQFFTWARNLVVDAYYTSPAGVKDVGYVGNTAVSVFSVPKGAVDYVMKRSPFANEV